MTATPAEEKGYKHHKDKKSTIITSDIREHKRSGLHALLIMLAMSIYAIGASFSGVFVLMVMTPYFESLGLTNSEAVGLKNLCAGFGVIAFLISVIVGGAVSDDFRSRFGNRLPMILIGATVSGVTHAVSPLILGSGPMLFVLAPLVMIIINIGGGFSFSPLLALLSELFTREERVWGGMVIAGVGIVGTAMAYSIYPGLGDDYVMKWTVTGAFIAGTALLTFILTPKTNPGFPPDATIPDILKTPIYLFKLGGGRNFVVMFIVQALWGASLYSITLNMNDFLGLKLLAEEVTIIVFVVGVGGALFAVPVGLIINKLGKTRAALVGTVVLALYVVMLTIFTDFWPMVLVAVIGGIGTVFIQTVSVALPADIVPEGKEGQFMGIFTFAQQFPNPIMAFLGTVLFTSAIGADKLAGYNSLFLLVIVLLIMAGFMLLGLNYENMLESEYNAWYKRYLEFRGFVKITIDKSIEKLDTSASILRSKMLKDSL